MQRWWLPAPPGITLKAMVCFVIHTTQIRSGNSRKSFLGHLSSPEWQPEIAQQLAAQLERNQSEGAKVPGCWGSVFGVSSGLAGYSWGQQDPMIQGQGN